MQLNWVQCAGDVWCNLNTVNLAHKHFENMTGVYVIWHGGSNAKTVRVGQGIIKDRIADHRKDPLIQKYSDLGLFVTWASVDEKDQDGIERYLANKLNPLVGSRFPESTPITINLPW